MTPPLGLVLPPSPFPCLLIKHFDLLLSALLCLPPFLELYKGTGLSQTSLISYTLKYIPLPCSRVRPSTLTGVTEKPLDLFLCVSSWLSTVPFGLLSLEPACCEGAGLTLSTLGDLK